ncbi:MAG: DNA methyltransferase [Anaerolineaceae bacterium]|nr:DNA methyltransferase [Anaerolineaceae bacterium]
MGEANWANRSIFTGDNLDVMRGMNSDSVDLIYLDPPFNSNRIYSAPVGSEAAAAAFKDAWTMNDVKVEEHGEVAERNPAMYVVIDAAGQAHGKAMKAYLTMMGARLLEMQRVLKSTGSIYLHCDPTAGHYLKVLMDSVFGQDNFRNEIVWKRTSTHSDAKRWARVNDYILYYVGGEDATWSVVYAPYDKAYVARHYRHDDGDDRGPYRLDNISSPNPRENLMYEYRGYQPPKNGWRYSLETMKQLDAEGRIWYPASKQGRLALKRYLNEMPGRSLDANWADINPLGSQAKERVGYPTQKPLALLERIIKAGSEAGDVVFDPFCGCGTACIAAERLERQWLGIDLSARAAELVLIRAERDIGALFPLHHREDIPKRTDLGVLPNYRTHKHTLFGQQEGLCAGCGHAFPFRNFTIDHIVPRARGGPDHLDNLQLLCNACNSMKGTRSQAEFRAELRRIGIT